MAPMPAGRDSRGGRMELNVTLVRRAEKLGFREKQGIQRVVRVDNPFSDPDILDSPAH